MVAISLVSPHFRAAFVALLVLPIHSQTLEMGAAECAVDCSIGRVVHRVVRLRSDLLGLGLGFGLGLGLGSFFVSAVTSNSDVVG